MIASQAIDANAAPGNVRCGEYPPNRMPTSPSKRDWQKVRRAVLKRDGETCLRCQRLGYMVYVADRAAPGIDGLITLCWHCYVHDPGGDGRKRGGAG